MKPIPKLDLKKCLGNDKPVDYQAYSLKLEENLKQLRLQISKFETDHGELTVKYREESKKLQDALQLNKRLL